MIHIVHATPGCFFSNSFLGLFLCAHEQDGSTICGYLLNKLVRFIQACYRLLQVNNMDAIAIHKDEWSHLGVPTTGLMPKVNTSFKKLLHRDNVCQKQDPPFLFLRSFLINAKVSSTRLLVKSFLHVTPTYLPLYLQL